MPRVHEKRRTQEAVLWEATAPDAYGDVRVKTPVELSVRWKDRLGEAAGGQGGSDAVDATVIVDREVPVGSILWQGRLADWDPARPQGLMAVTRYVETPDLKGRFVLRKIELRRHGDRLPTVVA